MVVNDVNASKVFNIDSKIVDIPAKIDILAIKILTLMLLLQLTTVTC